MNHTSTAIFGILFIFLMTTLGACVVFVIKNKPNQKFNSILSGLSAGIMFAASFWSLLLPALELAERHCTAKIVPVVFGFLLGAAFINLVEHIFAVSQNNSNNSKSQNALSAKSFRFFVAVTLHNIPEGLSVGFAFGSAALLGTQSSLVAALGLAVGIGIQNFPEGAAVALPFFALTGNKGKSFAVGSLSGAVEPVFAVLGLFLASSLTFIQPWLLSFAAGAMIFAVVDDLLPESKKESSTLSTWCFVFGFVLMMILDVVL